MHARVRTGGESGMMKVRSIELRGRGGGTREDKEVDGERKEDVTSIRVAVHIIHIGFSQTSCTPMSMRVKRK